MDKLNWLIQNLDNFLSTPGHQVLIFANQIQTVEQLLSDLSVVYRSRGLASIHGDKSQPERTAILAKVRSGVVNILIATNVAARGLDIPAIKTVVNYDCAKDKEDHIHRIGRTGRAGDKEGVAYTLLTAGQTQQASMMVKVLEQSNQVITRELEELAMQDAGFRRQRVTIGVKGFSMKVNIKAEQEKMKKTLRKIGDRSGIGAAEETMTKKDAKVASEVDRVNQKIQREAESLMQMRRSFGGEDLLDRLDQYSDRFKETMKSQFNSSFVSSGAVLTGPKEATVTYLKKGD